MCPHGPPVAVGPGKKFRVSHPLSGPDRLHLSCTIIIIIIIIITLGINLLIIAVRFTPESIMHQRLGIRRWYIKMRTWRHVSFTTRLASILNCVTNQCFFLLDVGNLAQ